MVLDINCKGNAMCRLLQAREHIADRADKLGIGWFFSEPAFSYRGENFIFADMSAQISYSAFYESRLCGVIFSYFAVDTAHAAPKPFRGYSAYLCCFGEVVETAEILWKAYFCKHYLYLRKKLLFCAEP